MGSNLPCSSSFDNSDKAFLLCAHLKRIVHDFDGFSCFLEGFLSLTSVSTRNPEHLQAFLIYSLIACLWSIPKKVTGSNLKMESSHSLRWDSGIQQELAPLVYELL